MLRNFNLSTANLVRQDTTKVTCRGAVMNVGYRLHKDDFPNPKDPLGNPDTIWCLHLPQINSTYVDESEDLVFEALHEFFEEDFVRYYAQKLIEKRQEQDEKK
jgi:hypothetical protein